MFHSLFKALEAAKSGCGSNKGFFFDAIAVKTWLEVNPKVRVRLKLGVLR